MKRKKEKSKGNQMLIQAKWLQNWLKLWKGKFIPSKRERNNLMTCNLNLKKCAKNWKEFSPNVFWNLQLRPQEKLWDRSVSRRIKKSVKIFWRNSESLSKRWTKNGVWFLTKNWTKSLNCRRKSMLTNYARIMSIMSNFYVTSCLM